MVKKSCLFRVCYLRGRDIYGFKEGNGCLEIGESYEWDINL